jgi:hypothetical protein
MLTARFLEGFQDCLGGRKEGERSGGSMHHSEGKRAINDGKQLRRYCLSVHREGR